MKKRLNIGLDVGSTTVKIVAMDYKKNIIYKNYKRHLSDTKKTVIDLLNGFLKKHADEAYTLSLTGSGAISLAKYLNLNFVQEVIACKNAIMEYAPEASVAIELGGEDAKIIYFDQTIEQRMNSSCAGGTGSFLDQMAVLLNTTTDGLNELAKKGEKIYPIASRCGVFAKTDIQPLINEGIKKEDIALSIMQAVVNQTISGLACGKPIKGNVIFLGGPLNYLSTLRERFISTLNLSEGEAIVPEDANLFVCRGAILNKEEKKTYTYSQIKKLLEKIERFKETTTSSLKPLFVDEEDYNKFKKRQSKYTVPIQSLDKYSGNLFLGIDAGSTTAKLVLVDENSSIRYQDYQSNEGTPVDTIKKMLLEMYNHLPSEATIASSAATGYGEMLIKTAFHLDTSEIETMAHYQAANHFLKGVESIIDIGGQDMKYIKIKDNSIDSIMLNEACSSGCGSFIETLAKSLHMTVEDFVAYAIWSKHPIDLGSRCTVFMNSKIKQTQKEGRPLSDIFAGLAYSVVRNALQKVMKIRDNEALGNKIVVQGGTFLNDAVLRSFELITGKEVIRPNIAGLMGAYGVALISKKYYEENKSIMSKSTILTKEEIENFTMKTSHTHCGQCENHCSLTVHKFQDKIFISGNRCERGSGNNGSMSTLPNMYAWKYKRLFSYKSLEEAPRGEIGIPRVLNMYEDYPLWHTLLTNLGFKVILSDHSSHSLYEKGIESMPSESVCYPAKLVHGHIMNLIEKGVKTIFYPCIMYENQEFNNADNHYNCPIVQSYSEAIRLNVEALEENNIKFINPFLPLTEDGLYKRMMELAEFKEYHFSKKELQKAIKEALKEQKKFKEEIRKKGEEFLDYIVKHHEKAIVLAGRPYHLDKEVNHGIDTLIQTLGLAVLTEDSICHLSKLTSKLRIVDQWSYHSRIFHTADVVSQYPNLEIVNLNSFGCGLDAIITDQAEEILRYNNRLYTTIKIDEINNLGAIKIRIRSLIASMNEREIRNDYHPYQYQKNYFKKSDHKHTILFPDMSPPHFQLFEKMLQSEGYQAIWLKDMNDDVVETGLKYVNNDSCYPAILVVGQLIHELKSGKYDLDNTSVIITQTGGGCRATNYIGLIRKGLKDAGLEKVSILSLNMSGLEKEQAFHVSPRLALKALQGVIYGDLLMKLRYATRPYEVHIGETDRVFEEWSEKCKNAIITGNLFEFQKNVKAIIHDFDHIKIKKKNIPKVGIVGEILIKYHAFGNDFLVEKLEKEGAEVCVPELMGFVKYCCYNGMIKEKILKTGKKASFANHMILNIIDILEKVEKNALKETRFRSATDIYELAKNVDGILSTGNQTGEGWFLTAEMVELMKDEITNIVCVQPFACLPNHIVGKSVIKKIRSLYKDANIVAIDYDPGASHTNQVNRIKLMLTVAKEKIESKK